MCREVFQVHVEYCTTDTLSIRTFDWLSVFTELTISLMKQFVIVAHGRMTVSTYYTKKFVSDHFESGKGLLSYCFGTHLRWRLQELKTCWYSDVQLTVLFFSKRMYKNFLPVLPKFLTKLQKPKKLFTSYIFFGDPCINLILEGQRQYLLVILMLVFNWRWVFLNLPKICFRFVLTNNFCISLLYCPDK